MSHTNLKVVPMKELPQGEKIYFEAENRFLAVCDVIERGANAVGYQGDAVIELLSSLQRMYVYSRRRTRA